MPSNTTLLRLLYVSCHALTILALVRYFSWTWLAVGIGVYLLYQVLGMGIGLHRYLSHRSFETAGLRRYVLLFFGTICSMGSPLTWAGVHRAHHQTADTPLDPHSPHYLGVGRVITGRYNSSVRIPISLVRDLSRDSLLLFVHRNYFKILLALATFLALIDLRLMLYAYAIPVTLCYWATAGGIVLNHMWGYRRYETPDRSVNSIALSLLTLGDGWHNNHHNNPKSYRHGESVWEFDLCAVLVKHVFSK